MDRRPTTNRLRYDYLLHATVRADEDWGLPYSEPVPPDPKEEALLRERCTEFVGGPSRTSEELRDYKADNCRLAQLEAASMAAFCYSRPVVVQASRDEHCTLGCVYCRPKRPRSCATMPAELWRKTLEVLLPAAMEFMPFCWGEPLIAPGFEETCAMAQGLQCAVSIISNLQHVTTRQARAVVKSVTRALVSIDTADPAAYAKLRRKGDVASIERNLEVLQRAADSLGLQRPWLGVSAVIMRRNLHDLPRLVRWAHEHGIQGFYAGRLVVTEGIRDFGANELVDLSTSEYRDVYEECQCACRDAGMSLSMCSPDGFLGAERVCPCPWYHVYVSASGNLSFCNFCRLQVLGTLPISHAYWNADPFQDQRRAWTREHRCCECQSADYDGRPGVSQFRGY